MTSFTDLESKVKTLLQLTSPISIKYKDEEEEWISISSDAELETGLLLAGNGIFRLICQIKPEEKNLTNNENTETAPSLPVTDFQEKSEEPEERPWKKYQRNGGERKWKKNSEKVEDEEGNKRWRKEKKYEEKKGKRERKFQEKREKRAKKEDHDDGSTSSSDSNSDVALMSLEEIKREIAKLKEEESILKEKVRDAKKNWKEVKNMISEKRKDDKTLPDEILRLREEVDVKKKVKKGVQDQLKVTRQRMAKLHEAAETKQV